MENFYYYMLPPFKGYQLIKNYEFDIESYYLAERYFYQNQIIRRAYFGGSFHYISDEAFTHSSIEYVEFAGRTDLFNDVFAYCWNLKMAEFSTGSRSGTFRNTNIKNFTIRENIPNYAYYECYDLETIFIDSQYVEIGEKAFCDCFKLKNVNFREGCTINYIGNNAFENCQIESFNFKIVSSIGYRAFRNTKLKHVVFNRADVADEAFINCNDLISVIIENELRMPDGFYDGHYRPSKNFFMECQSLEVVDLGLTAKTCIGMFRNCYNLKEVKSSNPELIINEDLFISCLSLTTLTSNIHIVYSNGFMFCKSLTDLDTSNIISISPRAFYGCEKLRNVHPHVFGSEYAFAFCSSLVDCTVSTVAGTGLLMNCTSLQSVTIQNVLDIPDKMFLGCTNLKTVNFPETITSIGHYAFVGTKLEIAELDLSDTEQIGNYSFKGAKIEKIKFGKDYIYFRENCERRCAEVCPGVTVTDQNPFQDVTNVKEIIIGADKNQFLPFDFQYSYDIKITLEDNAKLQINDGLLTKDNEIVYYIPTSSTRTKFTIPETITKIHPYAFSTAKLEEITINHYIETMESAFANNKYLKSITINFISQHKSLDNRIFENCVKLTNVNLCNYFNRFGDYSFSGCTSLETIIIPEGTSTLGRYCFANCHSLKSLKFPSNSLYFYDYCFYKCSNLTYLDFSQDYGFGYNAFDSSSLQSVTIKANSLTNGLFNNCQRLENVEFTDKDFSGSLPDNCFISTSLTEINIPPNVNSISNFCFAFSKIKKFFIHRKLTSIEPQAFYGIEDIEFELDCDHPIYMLGAHELIDKRSNTLVMTYGKLLSTYIVPSRVKSIGNNAINSLPRYNEETRKVVDFGLTTLVIRTKVKSDQSPVYNAPYLHNLCYGGSVKTEGLMMSQEFLLLIIMQDHYGIKIQK